MKRTPEEEKEFEEYYEKLNKELTPLYQELAGEGFIISNIDYWHVSKLSKKEAKVILPIFLKHLLMNYKLRNKDSILGKICNLTKQIKPIVRKAAWDIVLNEFEKATPDSEINNPRERGYKGGLAGTISVIASKSDIPSLLKIIQNKKHGNARLLLIGNIAKSKDNEAKKIVRNMVDDPDLEKEIKHWIKKGKL